MIFRSSILLAYSLSLSVMAADPASLPSSSRPLTQRRIFFGHQSVGQNLIDGLNDIAKDKNVTLRRVAWQGPASLADPGLADVAIGRNESPTSKIEHFKTLTQEGVGGTAEIAFFKFCYIDFKADTQVDALFQTYQDTVSMLAGQYPKTQFVHVTVPLTVVQQGPKAWLKKVLGKSPYGVLENRVRHQFNEKLRNAYGASGMLFDLAKAESTGDSGTLARFERDGEFIPYLLPGYTDDGEHLNALGRKKVAAELWRFLEAVPGK